MPLVNAKCTNCGANLQVDNTKDAAICRIVVLHTLSKKQ